MKALSDIVASGFAGGVSAFSASGGTGDVIGPASAADNALVRFDGTTGKLVQSSLIEVLDDGRMGIGGAAQDWGSGAGGVELTVGGTGKYGSSVVTYNDGSGAGFLFAQATQSGLAIISPDLASGSGFSQSNALASFYWGGTPLAFEDNGSERARFSATGKLLIGTTDDTGTSPFKVGGVIESLSGGFKFPDGSTQTTAASGASGAAGITTVNFGAFPGASDASVAITAQTGIVAGSRIKAWIMAKDTADHSADEHWLETLDVMPGNIAPGTGFTIYAKNTGTLGEPAKEQWAGTRLAGPGTGSNQPRPDMGGGKGTRLYGTFTVAWEWI